MEPLVRRSTVPALLVVALVVIPDVLAAQADPAAADTTGPGAGDSPAASTSSAESPRSRRGQLVALPFVFYTPETRFGGGGAVGYYVRLDPAAEPSSFQAAATLTARRQWTVEWAGEAYLRGGGRAGGELRFTHYPDVFFGVGADTPEALEEDYTARIFDAVAALQRPVAPRLKVGVRGRFRHESMVEIEDDGLLAGGTVRGSDGGRVVGVGALGTWDGRDNRFSPRRGGFLEASWAVHDGVFGSDFDFHRIVVDGRYFVPVATSSVLGFQTYFEAAPGHAPFSLLPLLGGQDRLRGYRQGRFRDRTLIAAQAELRFPIRGRFGGAAFATAGDVARDLGDLDLGSMEFAGGAGLRFRMTDDGVVLRGDLAVGREGGGMYFTIGQAF